MLYTLMGYENILFNLKRFEITYENYRVSKSNLYVQNALLEIVHQ